MRRLLLCLATLGLFFACGDDETVRSVPAGPASTAPTNPLPDASLPDAPPKPKRTIIERNPFGNVHAKDNLLWDGDFEWHTEFAQQYGWVNASQLVGVSSVGKVRVGPECRSGMKCGLMTQNQKIAAIGVSPGAVNVSASVWVKVPTAECADMTAVLIDCDYGTDPDIALSDADGEPDASGWCHYEAVSAPRERAVCLLVAATFAEGEAFVDDAVVRAAPGSTPTATELSSAERASMDQTRTLIRERLRPAPPGRRQTVEALERWARSRQR